MSSFRDWRLFNCRTGPSGNCPHYETNPGSGKPGCPAPHAVPYAGVIVKPSFLPGAAGAAGAAKSGSGPQFVGRVAFPPQGQWSTFFLEARWAAADGGFRFTTQQSIVPVKLPFDSCKDDPDTALNCKRMV